MKRWLGVTVLGVVVAWTTVKAEELVPGILVETTGVIRIEGGIWTEILHFGPNYACAGHEKNIDEEGTIAEGTLNLAANFKVKDGNQFQLTEKVAKAGDAAVDFNASVKSEGGIATEEMSLALNIPVEGFKGKTITAGDKSLVLPEELPKGGNFLGWFPDRTELSIPLPNGKTLAVTSNGQFNFLVQDQRKWNNPSYQLRIHFTPAKDESLKESSLTLKFEIK